MGMNTLLQNPTAYGEGKSALTAKCHRARKHLIHTMKATGSTCLLGKKEKLTGSLCHSSCPTSSIKYVGVLGLHLKNPGFVVGQGWELLTWMEKSATEEPFLS